MLTASVDPFIALAILEQVLTDGAEGPILVVGAEVQVDSVVIRDGRTVSQGTSSRSNECRSRCRQGWRREWRMSGCTTVVDFSKDKHPE